MRFVAVALQRYSRHFFQGVNCHFRPLLRFAFLYVRRDRSRQDIQVCMGSNPSLLLRSK
nr:MAG TPA: hypothetical protein [Caudoviricetes sp.]